LKRVSNSEGSEVGAGEDVDIQRSVMKVFVIHSSSPWGTSRCRRKRLRNRQARALLLHSERGNCTELVVSTCIVSGDEYNARSLIKISLEGDNAAITQAHMERFCPVK